MASSRTRWPGLMRPSPAASARASGIEAAEVLAWRSIGQHDLLRRQVQALAHAVDDAPVGLVRHQPVDLGGGDAVGRDGGVDRLGQLDHGMAEDLAALHAQMARGDASRTGRRRHRAGRDSGRRRRDGWRARRGRRLLPLPSPAPQHDRAGAVAEQHAGAAVVPVEDARKGLRADHERGARLAHLHEIVGHRERDRRSREQTACTSKATPRVMPSAACTRVAVAGKVSSGVEVASTMRSMIAAAHAGMLERRLGRRGSPDRRSSRHRPRCGAGGCRCAARSTRPRFRVRAPARHWSAFGWADRHRSRRRSNAIAIRALAAFTSGKRPASSGGRSPP